MKHLKGTVLSLLIMTVFLAGVVQAQEDDHHTVGIIMHSSETESLAEPFLVALAELGYFEEEVAEVWAELMDARIVELDTLTVIFPPVIGDDLEGLPDIIQSMRDAGVVVLLALTQDEAVAVQAITDQIPMVFATGYDPVGDGLVESLEEPGGNVTGTVTIDNNGRRLQLLVQIDPTIKRIFYPYNPEGNAAVNALSEIQNVAESLDLEIVPFEFSNQSGVLEAIRNVPEDIDAIFLSTDLEHFELTVILGWVGASNRLKVGISIPAYVEVPGVLMGYGPDLAANSVAAAGIVDQILRGADPADMPVLNSEYRLMVNLVAAEAIGIDIPRAILRQADLIIRPSADE